MIVYRRGPLIDGGLIAPDAVGIATIHLQKFAESFNARGQAGGLVCHGKAPVLVCQCLRTAASRNTSLLPSLHDVAANLRTALHRDWRRVPMARLIAVRGLRRIEVSEPMGRSG